MSPARDPKRISAPASPGGSVHRTVEAAAFYQFLQLVPSLSFSPPANLLSFVGDRHPVVSDMRQIAAAPFAAALVVRAGTPADHRACALSLPRLQLARVAP